MHTPPPHVVTEYAPAKLNLSLRVVGRRIDGYHLIESLIVPVTLHDFLRIAFRSAPTRTRRVRLAVRGLKTGVPRGRANLIVRAAHEFLAAAGEGGDVTVLLDKAIPPASGLGGGSSDAAATLRGLTRLCPGRLSSQRLAALGADLGADVPFFLACRAARVRGIGEIVRPYYGKLPPWYLVVVPRRGVSTAAAYAALRLTTATADSKLGRFRYAVSSAVNDLEKVVISQRPDIGRLKECLLEAGAQMALMSGSGSAVFGTFGSRRHAAAAARRMPPGLQVFVVRSVATSSGARRRTGRSPSW